MPSETSTAIAMVATADMSRPPIWPLENHAAASMPQTSSNAITVTTAITPDTVLRSTGK